MAVTSPMVEPLRPDLGITAPLGYLAGAAAAGIKSADSGEVAGAPGRLDVAVLYSERPATAAAVFTTNLVKAAPVVISQLNLKNGHARALVVNSGNANACTGSQGFKDALVMGKLAADALDLDPAEVLVASTGVIGRPLPMARIESGVVAAARHLDSIHGEAAADAIMTTDTRRKEAVGRFSHDGYTYTIGGMAKGSGMIHINMATMLGFLATDASVPAAELQQVLTRCVERTFNMVTVDGDTSTNDMLAIFANGAAGGGPLLTGAGLEAFETALTAIHGGDPNWGRIVAALGRAGAELVLDRLTVTVGEAVVFRHGAGIAEVDLDRVRSAFESEEVKISCELGLGEGAATAYGCDLSAEYVHINADYTT